MPQSVSHVLLPTRSSTGHTSAASSEPAFSTPVRWTLRVLSWLAFGVMSYVAWKAMNQTAVAGCVVGSGSGCDVVLTSSWSKWLGIPVAVAGLACYSALAILSSLLGLRNESANRWITTILVMLSVVAAGASLWFIGLQIFAIGAYCPYCLVTDACGIAIGAVATFAAARCFLAQRGAPKPRAMQSGLMASRTALPAGARPAPTMAYSTSSPPSLPLAFGGALLLLALLIGGQVLFASNSYDVQKVALNQSIEMTGSTDAGKNDASTTATTRIAMRPTELDTGEARSSSPEGEKPSEPAGTSSTSDDSKKAEPAPPAQPERKREVTLLAGKLKLDTYQHPLIGSPEAPHIVVEMISYDCAHCRKMHDMMNQALARYGNQVALLVMPVPLDKDCNKLVTDPAASHRGACETARLALGIARLSPSAFVKFHDFVMTGKDKPPGMERIIPKAYGLVDGDRLRELVRGQELNKQIEGYVDLYAQLQKQSRTKKEFGLPIQILGDHVITGDVEKADDVFKAWEEHLGVKAKQ